MRIHPVIKYLTLLLLAALLLWVSFKGVEWRDFITGLNSTNFKWILLSMAVSVFAFYIRALRWRMILMPINDSVTTKDVWDGINVGNITNFALPRAGELARCGVISRNRSLPFETVTGTVVLERSIDLLSLITISSAGMFVFGSRISTFIDQEIITRIRDKFTIGAFLILLIAFMATVALIYLINLEKSKFPFLAKVNSVIKRIFDGLLSGLKMKKRWQFLLLTLALWCCYWLMSYTTILAFDGMGQNLGAVDALFLMVVGSFGWVIPVQGGIGAYHFIISLALTSVYGLSQTSGLVFATISHGSQAITMLLFGTISLLSFTLKR